MSTPDPIRAALERLIELNDHPDTEYAAWNDAVEVARAALAKDSDVDDVLKLAAIIRKVDGSHRLGAAALAEAILARWNRPATPPAPLQGEANVGSEIWAEAVANSDSDDECRSFQMGAKWALSRWARPAATPAPLEGEVGELVAKLRRLAPQNPLGSADPTILRAATLLSQLSAATPAVVPVAVSERLPGEDDRDAEGTCWVWNRTAFTWGLFRFDLTAHSHWLPAHALPFPAPQDGEVEA